MRRVALLLLIGCLLAPAVGRAQTAESLQLTLPAQWYAAPGVEMSLYFDNVVLTQTPEKLRFDVTCDIGTTESRRWTVTPTKDDVGEHALQIVVSDPDTREPIAEAKSTLIVPPAAAGDGLDLRLLIIGDSLTHGTVYPNEIARLLSQPGNPNWRMLGTHRPKSAAEGVAHEGYGGWTWQRFASQYEPMPDGTYRKRSSPFVYLGDDEKPHLDVPRYIKEECDGVPPDVIVIMLGINDCFSADPANPDPKIDAMFSAADKLLSAWRRAAPNAQIGLCLTTPPNTREAAFEANYKGRYSRWNWKRIQHRLVQRQLERYGKIDRQTVIPTELNLDPIDGYPGNNGVHPNSVGYQQIGASIYSWLKWRMMSK